MYEIIARNVLRRLPEEKIKDSLIFQGYDSLISVERSGEDVKLVVEDAADMDRLLAFGMTFIHRNYYCLFN